MKLNLASGTDIKPYPWKNLDIVPKWPGYPPCDLHWDARTDKIPFPDASVDEIVAGYLLLHVARRHHKPLLAEMFRVLQPGGRVQIGELDMPAVMRRWLDNPTDPQLCDLVWGEQASQEHVDFTPFEEFDKHCCGQSEETLRALMTGAGFVQLQRIQIHAADTWHELTYQGFKP